MNFNLVCIITVCKTKENDYLINLYSFFLDEFGVLAIFVKKVQLCYLCTI